MPFQLWSSLFNNSRAMLKSIRLLIALAMCSLAFPCSIRSQTTAPPSAASVLTVNSQLVTLDVVVTGADGKPVRGLKREDFFVAQDGVEQKIRDFETPAERPVAANVPALDKYGRQDWGRGVPLTIFVLDELNTPFDEKAFSADNLRRYLLAQPALLRSPAMLATVNYTGLNTLAGYTRDRDALLHSLEKRPPALPAATTGLELAAQTFAMLRQIAMAAEGMHTHINLVWLGRGFPAMDPNDFSDPDTAVLKKAIEDTANLLLASRITLYQVNPITVDDRMATANLDVAMSSGMGLTSAVASTASVDMLDKVFGFDAFVVATGGEMFYGRNDLDRFIADSDTRGRDFYTLTYVPPQGFAGTAFHAIRVVPKNPALHVTARNGFYPQDPQPVEPNLKDLGFDLKLAATGAMQYGAVGVRILSTTRHDGKLAVKFSVEDRSLSWAPRTDGSEATKVTVLLVSLDKSNQIETSAATTLHVAAKNAQDTVSGHLDTEQDVKLDGKSRSVRLIVRDESGKIGTADVDAQALAARTTR